MSILSSIFSKIFPHRDSPAAAPGMPNTAGSATASATAVSEVDVEAILNAKVALSGEKSNWRTSIVDLMKLLGLDSSLESRKALAQELHYTGDMNDSASMNIWLHKQVMAKAAANGGKVPPDLIN